MDESELDSVLLRFFEPTCAHAHWALMHHFHCQYSWVSQQENPWEMQGKLA